MALLFTALFLDERMESAPFITDYIIQPKRTVWVRINRRWQMHPEYQDKPTELEVAELIKDAQAADVVAAGPKEAVGEEFAVGGVTFQRNNFSFEISDKAHGGFRYRMHLSNELQGIELNIRVLRSDGVDARKLGFTDEIVSRLLARKTGLIVVAGKTGMGKSTTLAALVRELPQFYPESRLITVESPVEYPFDDLQGMHVSQRQVGLHVKSFKSGILNIKRESADFALIGEIQNEKEINGVFEAASAGHLVLTTCHAETIPKALDFLRRGGDPAIMQQRIATYVNAIVVQELVPALGDRYCYPELAYEILINHPGETNAITATLRNGTWDGLELRDANQQTPMSVRLGELVAQRKISRETANKVRPL
jgi:twitching motility protein PilT